MGFRELDGTTIVLEAPDDVRTWAQARFGRVLNACAETVLGPGATAASPRPTNAAPAPAKTVAPPPKAAAAQQLNPRLTFDQFVIGESNRLAHAAALAVAETPGPGLQPAVHLRSARAGQDPSAALDRELRPRARRRHDRPLHDRRGLHRPLRRRDPGRRHGRRSRRAYRGVDVLLVDDVQFLAQKAQDRAGVLPHLQRPAPGRRAARADVRPPPAGHEVARGPAARALRGRPGVRRARRGPRHAADDPAQAGGPGRRGRGRSGARSS